MARNDLPIAGCLIQRRPSVTVVALQIKVVAASLKPFILLLKTGVDSRRIDIERERDEIPFASFLEGFVYREAAGLFQRPVRVEERFVAMERKVVKCEAIIRRQL